MSWTALAIFITAILVAAGVCLAQTDPPVTGDWTVSDTTVIEDRTVELVGDLTIRSGGHLVLRNVTMRVHSTVSDVRGVLVEAGGRLVVEDGDGSPSTEDDRSLIARGAPSYGFSFLVERGASLRINRSVVQGAGQVGGVRGVLVRANDTEMRGATFIDGDEFGLRVEGTRGLSLRDCTFSRSRDGLVLRDVRGASVVSCACVDNDRDGVLLYNVTDSLFDHVAVQDNSLRGMEATACRNVTLSNLFVEGNTWGLVLIRVSDVLVREGTINDTTFGAVMVEGPSSDVALMNLTVLGTRRSGIEGTDVQDLSIVGCWVEGSKYHGIHMLNGTDGLLVDGCTVSHSGYDGIHVAKATGVEVRNCTVSGNGYSGVDMVQCQDVTLSGDLLEDNNYEGMNLDHVSGVAIVDVTVRRTVLYNGIKLQADTNNVTVDSCTLVNNTRSGIDLDAANNVTVVGCNSSQNALSGIRVEAGSNGIDLVSNELWMNAMEGLRVEASWDVTMDGGTIASPVGPLVNDVFVSRSWGVWLLDVTLGGTVRVTSAGNATVVDEGLGSYARSVSTDSWLDEAVWTTVHVLWPDLSPVIGARVYANSSDGERTALGLTDADGTVDDLPVTVRTWVGSGAVDRNPVTFRAQKGVVAASEQRTFSSRIVVTIVLQDDRPPIARAPDVTAELGRETTLDGTASYDNSDVATWAWTFDDGIGVVDLDGSTAVWTFLRLGTFRGTLNVTDAVGLWNLTRFNITVVDTTPPAVNLGGVVSVDQHTTVDLDGRGTEDNDPLLVATGTFSWTIFRGGGGETPVATLDGPLETWTFDESGSFVVVLEVTDQSGNRATGGFLVSVADVDPPIIDIGPDLVVDQGALVVVGFVVLEDNDPTFATNMTVTWSISGPDLDLVLDGPLAEFTPGEMGVFLVKVTVLDPSGNSAQASLRVAVRDTRPPTVSVGPDVETEMGAEVTLTGTAMDNDPEFPTGGSWWWNITGPDVDLRLRGPDANFTPPWIGDYTATLTVTDAAGNGANATVRIGSRDTSWPTFGAFSPDEGEVQDLGDLSVTVTVNDDGTGLDASSVEVRLKASHDPLWGPWTPVVVGSGGHQVVVTAEVHLSEGPTSIEFRCSDLAGNVATSPSYTVTVNSRPVLVLLSPVDGADFGPFDDILLDASGSYDPDPSDELTVTWASDIDGSLGEGPARSTRLSPGDHVLTVRVTDGIPGHEVFGSVNVTVRPVPSTVSGDDDLTWWLLLFVLALAVATLALALWTRGGRGPGDPEVADDAGGSDRADGSDGPEADTASPDGSEDHEGTPASEGGDPTNQ